MNLDDKLDNKRTSLKKKGEREKERKGNLSRFAAK